MLWMKRKLPKTLGVVLWTNQKLGAIIVKNLKYRKSDFESGMSEIRDRAQAAPVKSRKFRDNGLPVSG